MNDIAALGPRPLLIVAHPDDESLGGGLLLLQASSACVVLCTDGAPRDAFFWRAYGSRQRYAALRRREARAALKLAGVTDWCFLATRGCAFTDQQLHLSLSTALHGLHALVERLRPQSLLTTAYEGGHPDHDACSFLAASLARRHGLPVWEFPLYHRSTATGDLVRQRFLAPATPELILTATAEAIERKRRMIAAYASQTAFLSGFTTDGERFRPQPPYDYCRPPHSGPLNYEAWGWPVTGDDLCRAFQLVQQEAAA